MRQPPPATWEAETVTHKIPVFSARNVRALDTHGRGKFQTIRETTYVNTRTGERLVDLHTNKREFLNTYTNTVVPRRQMDKVRASVAGSVLRPNETPEAKVKRKAAEGTTGQRTRKEPAARTGKAGAPPSGGPPRTLPGPPPGSAGRAEISGLERASTTGPGFYPLGQNQWTTAEFLVPEALQERLPEMGYYSVAQNFIYTRPAAERIRVIAFGILQQQPAFAKMNDRGQWIDVMNLTYQPDAVPSQWVNMGMFESISKVAVLYHVPNPKPPNR